MLLKRCEYKNIASIILQKCIAFTFFFVTLSLEHRSNKIVSNMFLFEA